MLPTVPRRHFLRLLAAASVASTSAVHAREPAPKLLRIGTTAPGHLKFLLSRDQQFFDRALASQGTRVDYLVFTGGGAEVQTALASGAIDVAYTGASPALRLAARNSSSTQWIGVSALPVLGTISIVVPQHSTLRTLQDLRGKKVAYLAGTIRHSVFVKALQSVQMGIQDVDSLNMPFEASSAALARGDIDALVESDITVAPLVQRGLAKVLFDNSQHPEWEVPLLITANSAFAQQYPTTLETLLRADRQVAEWANNHFAQAVAIYARDRRTSVEAVTLEYPEGRFNDEPRITPQVLQTLRAEVAFMRHAKLLKGELDFDRWLQPRFVEAAYR